MTAEVSFDAFVELGNKLDREHDWRKHKEEAIWQTPIIGELQGSGTLDNAVQLGPVRGLCWSVRRLTLFGYTAGTAQVFINGFEPIFTVAANAIEPSEGYGRGEILLMPGDKLTVTGTGITGSVFLMGAADTFERSYLAHYIG